MDRTSKEQWLADYGERLESAGIAILADFRGVSVEEINGFRTQVRATEGIEFRVGKNTLFLKAFNERGWTGLDDLLKGPTGIILGDDDVVSAAKVAVAFAKDNEHFELKGGITEGQILDFAGIEALSKMPSKDELRARLLGLFTMPHRKLLALFNTPAQKMYAVLNANLLTPPLAVDVSSVPVANYEAEAVPERLDRRK